MAPRNGGQPEELESQVADRLLLLTFREGSQLSVLFNLASRARRSAFRLVQGVFALNLPRGVAAMALKSVSLWSPRRSREEDESHDASHAADPECHKRARSSTENSIRVSAATMSRYRKTIAVARREREVTDAG